MRIKIYDSTFVQQLLAETARKNKIYGQVAFQNLVKLYADAYVIKLTESLQLWNFYMRWLLKKPQIAKKISNAIPQSQKYYETGPK